MALVLGLGRLRRAPSSPRPFPGTPGACWLPGGGEQVLSLPRLCVLPKAVFHRSPAGCGAGEPSSSIHEHSLPSLPWEPCSQNEDVGTFQSWRTQGSLERPLSHVFMLDVPRHCDTQNALQLSVDAMRALTPKTEAPPPPRGPFPDPVPWVFIGTVATISQ